MKKFNPYVAATFSSVLLTVMIIVGELYSPFKDLLKSTFRHHWIAKTIIVAISFAISGFICSKPKIKGYKIEDIAWKSVIGSLVIIFLFFVLHYFV